MMSDTQPSVLGLSGAAAILLSADGMPVLRLGASGIPEQLLSRRAAVMLLVGSLCESRDRQLEVYAQITRTDRSEAEKVFEATRTCYEHILRRGAGSQVMAGPTPAEIAQLIKRLVDDAGRKEPVRPVRMSTPRSLTWIATLHCSYRCRYCYLLGHGGGTPNHRPRAPMPLARLRELFEEAAHIGVRHVTISGGEPLEYPPIVAAIRTLKVLGMTLSLVTKRYLAAELISLFSSQDIIGVSLDSCEPQVVSDLTGSPRAFMWMDRTLLNLVGRPCRKCVETVVTTMNQHQIPETLVYAASRQVDEIHLSRVMRSRYRNYNELLLRDDEWQNLCDRVGEKYPDLRVGDMSIRLEPPGSRGADPAASGDDITYAGLQAKPLSSFTCPKLDRDLVFDSQGNVYACHRIPEMIVGDVRRASLSEAWQSESLRRLAFPPRDWYHGTACEACEYFAGCLDKNRCLYYSLLAYGRCFIPDPFAHCRKRTCFARDYQPLLNPVERTASVSASASGSQGETGQNVPRQRPKTEVSPMRTLLIPRKSASLESVGSFIYLLRSGAKDDPDGQAEIHHLCEHLLFQNLDKSRYPVFTIFRTAMEYTIFQFLFPAVHLVDCLRQVSSLLWDPAITPESVAAEAHVLAREAERRRQHYVFDCATRIARSYWRTPAPGGTITMAEVMRLIGSRHQHVSYHLLSYVGPQDEAEVASALRSYWPAPGSPEPEEVLPEPARTTGDMDMCWYHAGGETLTLSITTPGYRHIPDFSFRILTDYLVDTVQAQASRRCSSFSHKTLFYPERGFVLLFFPGAGDPDEILSLVGRALASLLPEHDGHRDRMTSFLQAYELEWMMRCECTADIARELTCSALRGQEQARPESLLEHIRGFALEKHRAVAEKYLSIFTAGGRQFEKIDAP
jgi:radical SAM protein with 4Fe4S-binding SPASM domain